MKFLMTFFMLLVSSLAFATVTSDQQYQINHLSGSAFKVGLGDIVNAQKNSVKVTYDFNKKVQGKNDLVPTTMGGAVGDIHTGVFLPAKAIIERVMVDVQTAPTSGGLATIALKAEGAADLKGATAIASWTGKFDGIPVGTAATSVKTTVSREIIVTVGTAALTAGKFNIFVEYYVSD